MYCYICIVCGKQILLFLFVVGCVNDRLQHISNYVNNACLMLVTLKLTEACVYHLSVRVSGFPLKSQNENSGLFHNFPGPDMPNNQRLPLHCLSPQPVNFMQKQDAVKLHAIALLSMMTNSNVSIHNLLYRDDLTRALQLTY